MPNYLFSDFSNIHGTINLMWKMMEKLSEKEAETQASRVTHKPNYMDRYTEKAAREREMMEKMEDMHKKLHEKHRSEFDKRHQRKEPVCACTCKKKESATEPAPNTGAILDVYA